MSHTMKEQIFKLAMEIIAKIVMDLLDNGKIDNSNSPKNLENPPK